MKETLAYNVLETMQIRPGLACNAVEWGEYFEDDVFHYDGIGKRLSDLKKYGLVESKGDDEKGYMLYKVSEKGLCIKSFDDYKKAVYKPRTPKPKKTREESAVKKECKKENKAGSFMPDGKNKLIGGDVFKKECKMPCMFLDTACDYCKENRGKGERVSGPSEKEMREMFTSLCNKYEKDGISKEDIAVRFGVPLSYNGIISTCIKEMIDKDSPRSPPVGYTAGTQITTTHRNEQGDIVIGYSTNSPDLGESTEIGHGESMSGEYLNHSIVGKIKCKMPCMLLATACDTCKEAFKGLLPPKQPRYKRLRSAFTGK